VITAGRLRARPAAGVVPGHPRAVATSVRTPPAVRARRDEVLPARPAPSQTRRFRRAEKLDRRPGDAGEGGGCSARYEGSLGRSARIEPQDPGDPRAHGVEALEGGGGEGTAADRRVEELANRGSERQEFRQPQRDLGALLGPEDALPFEPAPKVAP
jgi:hypothetical protein